MITVAGSPSSRYAAVAPGVARRLSQLGAQVLHIDGGSDGRRQLAPMMWRFAVVDDQSVDVFIVRDADSRLTSRDAAAVADWLKTAAIFHCIRDHPEHSDSFINGGLWGARRPQLVAHLNARSEQPRRGR